MGKQLVLISHGLFCEELKKSTEMIMGPQENIHTVGLLPSESAEDFREEMALVDSAVNNICHVNERISNDDEEDE